jgi:hypothetical protein
MADQLYDRRPGAVNMSAKAGKAGVKKLPKSISTHKDTSIDSGGG